MPQSFSWENDGSQVSQSLWSSKAKQEQKVYDKLQLIEACVGIDAYLDFKLNDLKCKNLHAFFCEHECSKKPKPAARLFNASYIADKLNVWFGSLKCVCLPGWSLYKKKCIQMFTDGFN